MYKNTNQPKKVNIKTWIFVIIGIIAAIFLVLVIFANDIFKDSNNVFVKAFAREDGENTESVITQFFEKYLPSMIKTITYIIITELSRQFLDYYFLSY